MVDKSIPPLSLEDRSLESIAKYIKDGRAKKIIVVVGGYRTHPASTDHAEPDHRTALASVQAPESPTFALPALASTRVWLDSISLLRLSWKLSSISRTSE